MNTHRPLPYIAAAKCTGCGRCVGACGPHLLSLEVVNWIKTAQLDNDANCTGCSECSDVCPFGAISMIHASS
ncbi:MAG: 4Fe-4S dicluster domain-containing protein [Rhodoferax sp.]